MEVSRILVALSGQTQTATLVLAKSEKIRVLGIVPKGSGAKVVHSKLSDSLSYYHLRTYSPTLEYFPWILPRVKPHETDLIHAPPDHAVFLKSLKTPLVVTFHNYVLDPFMAQFSSRLQRLHYKTDLRTFTKLGLRQATAVTAVSEATAELVRSDLGYRGEITVLLNGIDTSIFVPPTEPHPTTNKVRVLFAGNLTQRKGAHWLPDIAARLRPEVELVIATGLRGKNFRKVPAKNVTYHGRVESKDMPALYQEADIYLQPTVREGGPSLVVLEAMASGLPVVASDIPSIAEAVHDGKGGILCPLGDTVAFADAINSLADAPATRAKMGTYNRKIAVDRFNAADMVQRYHALFSELLT